MESKLVELSRIYNEKKRKNKNIFRYKEPHILSLHQISKDEFELAIKHIRVSLNYYVILFIGDNNEVVLNVPLISSDRNLKEEYNQLIKDIKKLSIENVLEKYYENIKKSLENV